MSATVDIVYAIKRLKEVRDYKPQKDYPGSTMYEILKSEITVLICELEYKLYEGEPL